MRRMIRHALLLFLVPFVLCNICPMVLHAQGTYAVNNIREAYVDSPGTVKTLGFMNLKKILDQLHQKYQLGFVYDDKAIKDVKLPTSLLREALDQLIPNMDKMLKKSGLQLSKIGDKQYGIIGFKNPDSPKRNNIKTTLPNQIHITGVVKDKLGNSLVGVTVRVKESSKGTVTDEKGMFSLEVNADDSLEISYIGYQSQVMGVRGQTDIRITMEANTGSLNEVEVVAFGEQTKATVTGAIASISTKELKQSPSANLKVALAGRLPGLTVIQTSGEPGRDNTLLYLRGRGTLNGQTPLILVDGVERDIEYLDPNEVQTVTILKDASSTALFGVKGANGVVLVTTKRGVSGKPDISVTEEFGIQGFTRTPTILSSYEWATLKNQAWGNDHPGADPTDPTNQPPYSTAALQHFKLQDDPEAYPNHNWLKELTHQYVPQNRVSLNFSGGGGFVQYFVDLGYLYQGGQWKVAPDLGYNPEAFLKRYDFRANIDASLNKSKTLKTFLNLAGYLGDVNSPGQDDFGNGATSALIQTILYNWPSVQPGPLTPDGQVLIGSGNYSQSPWAMINRTGYQQETSSNITSTWGLEQDLGMVTPGLSAKFVGSFDTRTVYDLSARRDYERWVQIIDPNLHSVDGGDSVSYAQTMTNFENTPLNTSTSATFQSHTQLQFFVNYHHNFGKHSVTGMVMANQESWVKPGDRLPYHLRGLATRLTYGYNDRYNVEFDGGYNGSEQFAPGRRYGFFPAVSAGWVASNEDFLKGNPIITFLKARGSYGVVGNDQLGDQRFLYLDDISLGYNGYSGNLGQGRVVNEDYLGNPDLKWEIAKKADVGLELGLWDQLHLTVDLFNERRNNVLINRGSIPDLIGLPTSSLPPENIGVIRNHGYEISLKYEKVINSSFTILSNLNFNFARNKVLFDDEAPKPEGYAYNYRTTGYEIGQVFGYQTDGFYNSQKEIDQSGLTFNTGHTPRPGDLVLKDLNDDGIIDDKDVAPIGYSTVPEHTWGAAFSVTYKGFDISLLFQGAFHVSQPPTSLVWEWLDFRKFHEDAWTPDRAASGAKIDFPALSLAQTYSENTNTFFLQNSSYIRLKSAEIGYTLPGHLAGKIGAKRIRFYLNGLNMFTWDKMRFDSSDPELGSGSTYPILRVFNSGVNVDF